MHWLCLSSLHECWKAFYIVDNNIPLVINTIVIVRAAIVNALALQICWSGLAAPMGIDNDGV